MSDLVLVDTSAWTRALRRNGDPAVKARVGELLARESAAWCEIIRLELWNGVRGPRERSELAQMEKGIRRLSITADVWDLACSYASKARSSGLNVPVTDLVIFACAKVHHAVIEHVDKHFDLLKSLDPI